MIDFIIQLLCTITLLSGIWLTGNQQLRGPFICFVAEIFTTAVGIMHHAWSITVIGVVLAAVQGRNFFKWHREGITWAVLLGLSLSASPLRGPLPSQATYSRGPQQAISYPVDATTPWLYVVPFAGSRYPNARVTVTFTWGK